MITEIEVDEVFNWLKLHASDIVAHRDAGCSISATIVTSTHLFVAFPEHIAWALLTAAIQDYKGLYG